ncbi:hypothetical protein [Streptomyces sp. NPDC051211]|uniref:hypothetical protein n=1 Tax=Streptomyces sp. NPDC051211 TaxID=3154643 RepID=UPI0034507D7E
MGGMQDKRQEPGKGREEQERRRSGQPPNQDPAHPKPTPPARGKSPEEIKRRQGDRMRDEEDLRDEEL